MRMWPWVLTGDFLCIYQRTNRMPKDIHVDPEKFAAELISRLEGVLREREAQEKLEERLKRVRLVSAFQLPGLTHDCQMNVLHEFYNMQRFKNVQNFSSSKSKCWILSIVKVQLWDRDGFSYVFMSSLSGKHGSLINCKCCTIWNHSEFEALIRCIWKSNTGPISSL